MLYKTKLIPLEAVYKIAATHISNHYFKTNLFFWNTTDSSDEAEKWIKTLNEELFGTPIAGVICKYKCTE